MSKDSPFHKILEVPKLHKPQRAVKDQVAGCFVIDAGLFIDRFDIVSGTDSMCHRAFRAKAAVDLFMAVECSLKSLIISLSKDDETPHDAYKKARENSHCLVKLYKEVKRRAKARIKIPRKDKWAKFGVEARYSYEVWLLRYQAIRSQQFESEVSKTIEDDSWLLKLRNEAVEFLLCAEKAKAQFLTKHNILSGSRFDSYEEEISRFLNKIEFKKKQAPTS